MKQAWQQNRITEKELATIAQGAIEYWASGDWDFLKDFLDDGRLTTIITPEMEEMMSEASDQLEDIVAQWLIKEKGLTVTGNKMLTKQAWAQVKTHEELMEEAYALWQKPENSDWSQDDFVSNLPSQAHKDAVVLGNLNYQVGNGGFQQWFDNGYGNRDTSYLIIELLPKIGTPTALEVQKLLRKARRIQGNIEDAERRRSSGYGDEEDEYNERIYEQFEPLDDAYYQLDDQFMIDAEKYLQSIIATGSLNTEAWSLHKNVLEYPRKVEQFLENNGYTIHFAQSKGPAGYPNMASTINLVIFKEIDENYQYGYPARELKAKKEEIKNLLKSNGFNDVKVTNTSYGSILVVVPYQSQSMRQDSSLKFGWAPKYRYTFITHTFAHYMGAHGESKNKITVKARCLFDAYCFKEDLTPENFAEEMGFNIDSMRASDEVFIKAMGDNIDNEEFAITIFKDDAPLFTPEGGAEEEDEGEFEVDSSQRVSLKFSDYTYKPGEEIGYHGRVGHVVEENGIGVIVHFDDTGKEEWIDKIELLEQEGLNAPEEDELDRVLKLRDRARERMEGRYGSEEFPLDILPFSYNGFSGDLEGETPIARGKFIEKTNDPGIVKILLNTGKIQLVPTFAIRGDFEEPTWKNVFEEGSNNVPFGSPSALGSKRASRKFSDGGGTFEWPQLYLKDGMIVDYKGNQAFIDADQPNFNSVEEAENWLIEKNYRGNVIGDYNMRQASIKKAQEEDYDYYHDNFTPGEDAECEYCGKPGARYYNAFGQRLNFGGFDSDKLLCEHCAQEEFKKDREGSMKKKANGVALNMLSALFEDKFPMHRVPAELRVLRAKASDAIKELVNHIGTLGRDSTPPDFPMDWYYSNTQFATPLNAPQDYSNFVTETRVLFQEIIDYANKNVGGKEFYATMKTTIKKISRDQVGVIVLRELVDGKPYRYGYINEGNDYIQLKGHIQVPKYGTIYRPDTGTAVKVLGYQDIKRSTDNLLVEALMKKRAGDEADDLAESEWSDKGAEDWGKKPLPPVTEDSIDELRFKDLPEDSSEDDLFKYLKRRHNKLVDQFHDITKAHDVLQEEIDKDVERLFGPNTKDALNEMTSNLTRQALIKEAVDVSDDVPPMGWDATEPGVPAGSGAPKQPLQSLQNDDDKEQQKQDQGVLYDSTKDSGPQFQTTISPKDKSVTVKFLDSPEQDAFHKIIEQKPAANLDQLPKLNTTPPQGGQQPGQAPGQQEPGRFNEQEVPVVF